MVSLTTHVIHRQSRADRKSERMAKAEEKRQMRALKRALRDFINDR